MSVSPSGKKDALVKALQECMDQHVDLANRLYNKTDAKCNIDDRERDWERGLARDYGTRRLIMGDPLWYIQVLFSGPSIPVKTDVDGTWLGGSHRFKVMLYVEFKDADSSADSSTRFFEGLTDSVESPLGIIPFLRDQGLFYVGSDVLQIVPVPNDRRMVVPVESTGSVSQHVFTMDAKVRDIL